MSDGLVPLTGKEITPAGQPVVAREPIDIPARIVVGGPMDGRVLRSNSSRLDYRVPSITVREDLAFLTREVEVDVAPRMTYVPAVWSILSERVYRIWIDEKRWDQVSVDFGQSSDDLTFDLIILLIDADPKQTWWCIER